MQSVWSDIRFGARRLLANPGFTAVAATTLALGIGATTAIYSVVDALLLRPLPFRNAGTLVQVHGVTARGFMFPSLRYDEDQRDNTVNARGLRPAVSRALGDWRAPQHRDRRGHRRVDVDDRRPGPGRPPAAAL